MPNSHRANGLRLLACALATSCAPGTALAANFFWNTGDFVTGVTTSEPIGALDTLQIDAGGVKRFVGSTLTNLGTVRWLSDPLQGGNSASVTNGGLWQSESDSNSLTWNFGGQPTFINTGTFAKSAGATTNVGSWAFRNDGGLISAQVGAIVFNGTSNVFNTGSRFSGAGQVQILGGSTFNGDFQTDNLSFTGGTQTGNAAVLVGGAGLSNGLLGWSGGDLSGSWTLAAGTTLTASGADTKRQVGSSIINNGTFRWSTTKELQGGNSASFTNNGLTEATESASLTWNFGGQNAFVNSATGTVRATNNATLTFGNVALTSTGGLFEASAGSHIDYVGATNRFNDGTRFVGNNRASGTSRFVDQIQADDLHFVNGTQTGGDGTAGSRARLAGSFTFDGGDLMGAWEIKSGATLLGSGATLKRQVGSDILNNGTFRWSTTADLQGGNSSLFTNNGLTDVTESALFQWNFGGQHAFVNNASGTVRATNNATLTFGNVALTSNGGLFQATAGSHIDYIGTTNRFNDGTQFVGNNRVTGNARFVDLIHADDLHFVSGTQTGGDGVTPGSRGRLDGSINFEGGDLTGAWEIKSGTTVLGSGAALKRQVGSDILNNGTLRWSTTADLQGGNSSLFTNNGLTDVTESALFQWNFGGQHGFINNASGTVRATNNATLTFGNVALTSNGGLFEATAGSRIDYIGTTNRFNDSTRFVGNNRVTGNARFVDDIQADDLHFVSGTQTGGDGVTPGSRGRLDGTVNFEGGDLSGAWEIKNGSTLLGSGANDKRQVGSDIENNGVFRWSTAATFQGGNSSVFTNNGLTEATESALFQWNFGGQAAFINSASGTVRATNNTTLSFGNVALTSNGGLFEATAGSRIDYVGTTNRFNDGTRFVGNNRVTGNARFVDHIQADDLHFAGGTQTGGDGGASSTGSLGGSIAWETGDLNGAFEIRSGATMTGAAGGGKRLLGAKLTNNGSVVWTADNDLQGGNSSQLVNNGRLDMTTDADIIWAFGGQARLDNAGLLIKSGGTDVTSLSSLALTNTGTIDVRAGAIGLPNNFVNAGTLKGTGAFNLTGTLFNDGHVGPGASPGTLTVNGNYQQSALGSLDIEVQNLGLSDLLAINGNASLAGTLNVSCFANCNFAVGDEIVILDATGQLTGTFSNFITSGFGSGDFDIFYDDANDRVLLRVTELVTAPVPLPPGTGLLLSGLGALIWLNRRRQRGLDAAR